MDEILTVFLFPSPSVGESVVAGDTEQNDGSGDGVGTWSKGGLFFKG